MIKPQFPADFEKNYQTHIKRLKLNGLQPKTIEVYSHALRRAGKYFDYRIDALTEAQLTDYFSDLLSTHSWSALKHDLYGRRSMGRVESRLSPAIPHQTVRRVLPHKMWCATFCAKCGVEINVASSIFPL